MNLIPTTENFKTSYESRIPQIGPLPKETEYPEVLRRAMLIKAPLIIQTRAKTWYIKGNQDSNFKNIRKVLRRNVREGLNMNSTTVLIKYD